MDLERAKHLRNEYAVQHIISREQLCNEPAKQQVFLPEDLERDREAMGVYEIKMDGMTRQERRACQRMLAKYKGYK